MTRLPEFPVTRRDLLDAGLSPDAVKHLSTRSSVSRPFRGVYREGGADDRAGLIRAAHCHLGSDSVAVLGSAAALHGLAGPRASDVRFAMPRGLIRRQRAGVGIHFWTIPDADIVEIEGIPATSLTRTLADCARLLNRFDAVATLDSALDVGLIDFEDLLALPPMMRRRPGSTRGRRHLAEARRGAQSPLETRTRPRAADGGLPPDRLQAAVRTASGALLGYADQGYDLPSGGLLAVEADGVAFHDQPEAVLYDRRRQNSFIAQDVEVVRFTWEDTMSASAIPAVLRPILARHGWHPSWIPRHIPR